MEGEGGAEEETWAGGIKGGRRYTQVTTES